MISSLMMDSICQDLKDKFDLEHDIKSVETLRGGDVNASYFIHTNHGNYALKINYNDRYPQLFKKEANGLKEIRNSNSIYTPQVISTGIADYESYILLEFIDKCPPIAGFWEDFAQKMSKLHQHSNDQFGFYESNYIGTLIQENNGYSDFATFFIEQRLMPQINLASQKKNLIPLELRLDMEDLFKKIPNLIPHEKPSLLHGDLWSGNFISGPRGAILIDPAVYYGHREVDLAMTKLFGGFDVEFYNSYHEMYELEPGWEERIELWNLYPLLVHLNLFGLGYLKSIQESIQKFI